LGSVPETRDKGQGREEREREGERGREGEIEREIQEKGWRRVRCGVSE